MNLLTNAGEAIRNTQAYSDEEAEVIFLQACNELDPSFYGELYSYLEAYRPNVKKRIDIGLMLATELQISSMLLEETP